MRKVEAALLWEEELIKEFDLGRAVGEETLVVGVQELVQRYGEGVVGRREGGCAWLLQQKKHEELRLMYRLFKREALTVAAAQTAAAAAAAAAAKEAARTAAAAAAALAAAAAGGRRGGGEGGGGNNPPSTPPYPAFPSVSALPPLPPPPPLPLPHGSRSTTELASLSALSLSSPPSLPASSSSSSSSSEHPLLDKMGVILEKHIISLGEALQEDRNLRLAKERKLEAYDPIYIAELLKMHSEYVELTTSVLGAHSVFKSRLHAAFVVILNQNGREGGKGPEEKPRLITTACDRLLRVGGASEEAKVNEILGLVVYLKDKDYFESCYRTEMMRRLLANRNVCVSSLPPSLASLRHGVHSFLISPLPPSLPSSSPPGTARARRNQPLPSSDSSTGSTSPSTPNACSMRQPPAKTSSPPSSTRPPFLPPSPSASPTGWISPSLSWHREGGPCLLLIHNLRVVLPRSFKHIWNRSLPSTWASTSDEGKNSTGCCGRAC